MLKYAVIFLVIALVAAVLGFGNLAGAASSIAVTLFFVFIAIAVVMFLYNLLTGRKAL